MSLREVGPGTRFHNKHLQLACAQYRTVDDIAAEAIERLRVLWPRLVPVLEGCLTTAPAARWTAEHVLGVLEAPNTRPFSFACPSLPAQLRSMENDKVLL